MLGFPPFAKNGGDQAIAAHAEISSPNDKVVGLDVVEVGFLIGGDAFVLVMPLLHQLTNGSSSNEWEVASNMTGVFPCEFYVATKGKIVTYED